MKITNRQIVEALTQLCIRERELMRLLLSAPMPSKEKEQLRASIREFNHKVAS